MPLSRKEVIDRLARASAFGHLGLFVGSGFSKALTDEDDPAPSFPELLQQAANKLKIDFDFDDVKDAGGKSYPQIASELVKRHTKTLADAGVLSPAKNAHYAIKVAASNVCNVHATDKKQAECAKLFQRLRPSWVVTTNYDTIVESLVDRGVSLLPDQLVTPRSDFVPIYHLHGDRRRPESIVITEEDYVNLMGPIEYRQLKLSLLLTESATLMLGYSLGDVNVRSATQWLRTFHDGPEGKGLSQNN